MPDLRARQRLGPLRRWMTTRPQRRAVHSATQDRDRIGLPTLAKGSSVVFGVCMVVYFSNANFSQPATDTISLSYTPFALLVNHTFFLNAFGPLPEAIYRYHHEINKYPVGSALTATPFYVPYILFGGSITSSAAAFLGKVSGSALTALAAAFLVPTLARLGIRRWIAVASGLTLGLATESASITSQGLWQQSGLLFWLTIFLHLFVRIVLDRPKSYLYLLWGFTAAMLFLCRTPDVILVIIPLGLICLRLLKLRTPGSLIKLGLLIAGTIPVTIFYLVYNYIVFHSALATGYVYHSRNILSVSSQFNYPLLEGLRGMLLSGSKGWLLYTPWLGLIPVFLVIGRNTVAAPSSSSEDYTSLTRYTADHATPRLALAIVSGSLALSTVSYLLLMSKFFQWPAGYSYGPRYEVDIGPYIVTLLAIGTEQVLRQRCALSKAVILPVLSVLLVWSTFTQVLGLYSHTGFAWNQSANQSDLFSINDGQLAFYIRSWLATFSMPQPVPPINAHISLTRPRMVRDPNKLFNIAKDGPPLSCYASNHIYMGTLRLTNDGPGVLPAFPNRLGIGNFLISYHLFKGTTLISETGVTTNIMQSLAPHSSELTDVVIDTPANPGRYTFVITGLQEGVKWFQIGRQSNNATSITIRVSSSCK